VIFTHIRTRNTVERLFGVWRRRFPAMAYGLRIKLRTTLALIVATAVLHNLGILSNEEDFPPAENIDPDELEELIENGQIHEDLPLINGDQQVIINTRNHIINNYFAPLPDE
jgi:hypothetical protein